MPLLLSRKKMCSTFCFYLYGIEQQTIWTWDEGRGVLGDLREHATLLHLQFLKIILTIKCHCILANNFYHFSIEMLSLLLLHQSVVRYDFEQQAIRQWDDMRVMIGDDDSWFVSTESIGIVRRTCKAEQRYVVSEIQRYSIYWGMK